MPRGIIIGDAKGTATDIIQGEKKVSCEEQKVSPRGKFIGDTGRDSEGNIKGDSKRLERGISRGEKKGDTKITGGDFLGAFLIYVIQ